MKTLQRLLCTLLTASLISAPLYATDDCRERCERKVQICKHGANYTIMESNLKTYFGYGATAGTCGETNHKYIICHNYNGSTGTQTVSQSDLKIHIAHGDRLGRCYNDDCECGNGILEKGEECDDGNDSNSDGCSNTCKINRSSSSSSSTGSAGPSSSSSSTGSSKPSSSSSTGSSAPSSSSSSTGSKDPSSSSSTGSSKPSSSSSTGSSSAIPSSSSTGSPETPSSSSSMGGESSSTGGESGLTGGSSTGSDCPIAKTEHSKFGIWEFVGGFFSGAGITALIAVCVARHVGKHAPQGSAAELQAVSTVR